MQVIGHRMVNNNCTNTWEGQDFLNYLRENGMRAILLNATEAAGALQEHRGASYVRTCPAAGGGGGHSIAEA